jgi:hypothetical protein
MLLHAGDQQVRIVVGDVLESLANVLLVPCSTTGSMGGAFRNGIKTLGITKIPGPLKAGQVATVPVSHSGSTIRTVLIAAVVAPEEESAEAAIRRVEAAARRAGEVASSGDIVVASPLLATGAGGLEPGAAARAMATGFAASAHPSAQMWIHVLSQKLYDEVQTVLSVVQTTREQTPAPSGISLRPGTRELLSLALAVALGRGASTATGLDVILAAMVRPARTSLDKEELAEGATIDLVRALPPPAGERIAAALSTVGIEFVDLHPVPSVSIDDPRLAAVMKSAYAVVLGLGSEAVWSHHLVGAALAAEQIPAEVLAALGVSQEDLRVALRSGIARRWPSEAAAFWTSRLGSPLQAGRTRLVHDQPALVDELGRLCLAQEMASLLGELASIEDRPAAFALHLDAPWGAGKTTVVNFVIRELQQPGLGRTKDAKSTSKPWTVIQLDAWRSSQLSPAWWALLTHLRQGVRGSLGFWWRLMFDVRHFGRSFLRSWQLWIPPAAVLTVLAVLWLRHTDVSKMMAGAAATIAFAATVGGLASRFFSLGTIQGARLHERLSNNPMEEVATQIWEIQRESRQNVLLVLDDLDRCNEKFTVELLDAIQTLLRNPTTIGHDSAKTNHTPALVVLAVGDGRWLRAAYEHTYSVFSPYVKEPGRPLGNLFLDKLFQVRVDLPNPSRAQISDYLTSLLEVEAQRGAPKQEIGAIETLIREAPEQQDDGAHSLDNRLSQIMAEASNLNPVQRQDLAAMALDTRRKDPHRAERQRHLLEQYAEMVEPNPRAAKRFIMAYSIAFASHLVDPDPIPAQTLALWTLIAIRWPALAEWIRDELPDGSLEPVDLDHHPSRLLADPRVQRVIASEKGGPLDRDMLLRCCGYPVP